jgi:hypothetical protein
MCLHLCEQQYQHASPHTESHTRHFKVHKYNIKIWVRFKKLYCFFSIFCINQLRIPQPVRKCVIESDSGHGVYLWVLGTIHVYYLLLPKKKSNQFWVCTVILSNHNSDIVNRMTMWIHLCILVGYKWVKCGYNVFAFSIWHTWWLK